MELNQIGIYGLGVMGKNLALNFEQSGFSVSVFNRNAPGEEHIVNDFITAEGAGKKFTATGSAAEFCSSLQTPRIILLMVKAGEAVDHVIDELKPFLEPGDIIIDGGNSHFEDTIRRTRQLDENNIHFVGMGVSGGEEGARNGPSLMPGGNAKAWNIIKPILEPVSARAFDGSPCCAWIGLSGAGHFVKMVHNGIEYADMQIIAEAYHVMKNGLDMDSKEISNQFKIWADTTLSSYLFEITADIFSVSDSQGKPLVEKILDKAGQKGTGKWTAIHALELGVPLPTISQSVYARYFSSQKNLRKELSSNVNFKSRASFSDKGKVLDELEHALIASRMISHAEGFHLISSASEHFGWSVDFSSVAKIWQGGCIIRSKLLETINMAFSKNPALKHLLLDSSYSKKVESHISGWRHFLGRAVVSAIPVPAISSALNAYDSLHTENLPANLIQAQRDYFGAHTYQRRDKPEGMFYHTDWTGKKSE